MLALIFHFKEEYFTWVNGKEHFQPLWIRHIISFQNLLTQKLHVGQVENQVFYLIQLHIRCDEETEVHLLEIQKLFFGMLKGPEECGR